VLRNGLGVVGATVTVYVNGTDAAGNYAGATKAALFSDKDGTVPLANPVVTDANGEFAYFVPNGIYDEVVKYGSITDTNTYIQMFDQSGGEAIVATAQAVAARDEALAAAADATAQKVLANTAAGNAATSADAADESATTAQAARGDALAAAVASQASANTAADEASAALDAQTQCEALAAQMLAAFQYAITFAAVADVYIPASIAMTLNIGAPTLGTGTLSYEKSTAADPTTFAAAALPVTLQAGAWLKVRCTALTTTFLALHLQRTA
jgi:hypothetical protein